ncbi:hypothetical protein GCM10010435_92610 [Winogradskya consettensis]|uniref:Concanavalin A-like lectin/glucanase superfamily protein n=1 Tax=Winogradskya consettensis TaxID=113560 RepID=A0A919VPC4_9ACTN|nr:LamG-like jellyroll fold domain-containing protein [Actinoplanes consettensis]GIM71186.1 hypothetical protein Aco04nite_24040 [Actinoplanes consettensis]
MRFTATTALISALALASVSAPASASPASGSTPAGSTSAGSTSAGFAAAPAAAAAPVTVARYTFDTGTTSATKVSDLSQRGSALTIRSKDKGRINFNGTRPHTYAAFAAPCAAKAPTCPRALLEGTDDADLDPGTRQFRWGASVRLTKAQVAGSSNVMQKGVVDTQSLWKMQIGATHGKAQCVAIGTGSTTPVIYLVRSAVTVADGTWHSVLCQRSGARLSVYVDGKISGTLAIPATLSISNNLPLRIAGPNFNTTSDMYHGLLDDVYARLG